MIWNCHLKIVVIHHFSVFIWENQANFVSQSYKLHEPPDNSAHIECIQPIVLGSNYTNYALTIIIFAVDDDDDNDGILDVDEEGK